MVALVSCRPSSGSFHSRHAPLEDTIAHQEVADYIAKYCQILPNIAKCFQILPNTAKYCQILSFSVFEAFGFVIFCRLKQSLHHGSKRCQRI